MFVRRAIADDLPAVLDIYNHVISTSTAVYADEPVNLTERIRWYEAREEQGYPILIAEDTGGIAGFASFGDWRTWPGYRFTVEHSVHVRADCRGRGFGRLLLLELIQTAAEMGKHVMIGGVDATNEASIRFHERLGFTRVAHFKEVGFKFGRWLDLIFVQRVLNENRK